MVHINLVQNSTSLGGFVMLYEITLPWSFDAIDGSSGRRAELPKGSDQYELIPSPLGGDCMWFCLRGTKIGIEAESLNCNPRVKIHIHN